MRGSYNCVEGGAVAYDHQARPQIKLVLLSLLGGS
jgi:hypothetical protein